MKYVFNIHISHVKRYSNRTIAHSNENLFYSFLTYLIQIGLISKIITTQTPGFISTVTVVGAHFGFENFKILAQNFALGNRRSRQDLFKKYKQNHL